MCLALFCIEFFNHIDLIVFISFFSELVLSYHFKIFILFLDKTIELTCNPVK